MFDAAKWSCSAKVMHLALEDAGYMTLSERTFYRWWSACGMSERGLKCYDIRKNLVDSLSDATGVRASHYEHNFIRRYHYLEGGRNAKSTCALASIYKNIENSKTPRRDNAKRIRRPDAQDHADLHTRALEAYYG
jgi:hypothetical protein